MSKRGNRCCPLRSSLVVGAMLAVAAAMAPPAAHAGGPFQYFALTPCRVVDTRNPTSVDGGPALTAGQTRNFQIRGNCGVPIGATAVTLNVTITQPALTSNNAWLALWPSGQSLPGVSTINFTNSDGSHANGAIVPLSTNTDDLSVILGGGGTVHVILDVTGYFQ